MAKTHVKNSIQRFKKFHGRSPEKFASLSLTMPKSLTYLGDAYAIEYESTKRLRGTFKKRLYRHKTGPGVRIYLHPDGKTLIIRGGNFRVNDWMRG